MKQLNSSLSEHYLICGFGRMGHEVCEELKRQGRAFVVVDNVEESLEAAREAGYLTLRGDPGLDATLIEGGIERARGLAAVSDDDAKNIMVVISAQELNPELTIVARASTEDVPEKFFRAGADSVYLPYRTGGQRITQTLLRPAVVSFLEEIQYEEVKDGSLIEAVRVEKGSVLDGNTVAEAKLREQTGFSVMGIIHPDSGIEPDLGPESLILAGDTLIVLGKADRFEALEQLLLRQSS
jgi:voltage-gated potassium channel